MDLFSTFSALAGYILMDLMESRELALGMTDFPLQSEDASGSEEFTQILKRALAGDGAAFEQIMVLHQRRVLVTALRLLGGVEDAQDAAQEVFLRLHRHLNRLHEVRDLSPWLYRVTVNVCNDLYRKRHRERQVSLEQARMVSADPEQDVELAEQRRLLPARASHSRRGRSSPIPRPLDCHRC